MINRFYRVARIAAIALVATTPVVANSEATGPTSAQAVQPVLATPAQREAEQALISLLADPDVQIAQPG